MDKMIGIQGQIDVSGRARHFSRGIDDLGVCGEVATIASSSALIPSRGYIRVAATGSISRRVLSLYWFGLPFLDLSLQGLPPGTLTASLFTFQPHLRSQSSPR